MYRRIALLTALIVGVVGVSGAAATPAAKTKSTSKSFKLGLYDEAQTLYGDPDVAFAQLKQLNAKIVRTNLYWGGRFKRFRKLAGISARVGGSSSSKFAL